MLKKRKRIIEKEKFKYWLCTHTFFVRVPKMVEEAKRLPEEYQSLMVGGYMQIDDEC